LAPFGALNVSTLEMPHPLAARASRLLCLTGCLAVLGGCSMVKSMAVKTVASTLAESGDVFTRDDDPELVADAIPFALKLDESLLESTPKYGPLLLATCTNFTEYAFAFVQSTADIERFDHYEEGVRLNDRALGLYLRAHGYCMRALEVRFHGITDRLTDDPVAAVARAQRKDVPLLYWTAASLGAAVALAPDRPDLLIEFPIVRALLDRALALDETWNLGAIHEALITLESLETLGGSQAKAREHFDRAVALQHGDQPGPYVALAMGVSVATQDRAEFEKLMNEALAVDPNTVPSTRLVTIVAQRRARALLDHADSLFAK
jgi:predicted anti-sigma-YlaC factor YlaD